MKKILTWMFVVGIISIASVGIFLLWQKLHPQPKQLPSPLSTIQTNITDKRIQTPKIVYGFVPYWLGNKAVFQPELTGWSYFSLVIDKEGNIVKSGSPGFSFFNNNFEDLQQTAIREKVKTDLTFAQFDEDELLPFLESPVARRQFFITLNSYLHEYKIDGINIDFEATDDVTKEQQQQFTNFIREINDWLSQNYPTVTLTIDVYPSSIERLTLWSIADLEPYVDNIVIMMYDFHRASSDSAGPIAPLLNTQQQSGEKNITYYLAKFLRIVPSEKILLGIPFYGYEWETTDAAPRSFTLPRSGATASLERIGEILSNSELTIQHFWEDSTLSPFLYVEKNDKHYVISYEDPQSLGYKLDIVNETNLGGIAIWALGYEGSSRQMWNVIEEKFQINTLVNESNNQ